MMILSAEYSHNQDKMASPCLPQSIPPRHSLYTGYLMDTMSTWHHPMKQEPEDTAHNDSGISPSHYNSDNSVQNTSPQSFHSEARSDDSGHADREEHQTNATLGVLARPIMETPDSPQHSALSLLAQSGGGAQRDSHHPMSPQRISPAHLSPLQQQRLSPLQQQRLSPQRLSPPHFPPQQQSALGYIRAEDVVPQSPRGSHFSPPQPGSRPSPSATPQAKPADDNSRSSASSAEMDLYYEDPLKGLQMALQRRGMIGPIMPELPVNGEKPLQCPLCQFSTNIRSDFNSHLMNEHSEQVSCHLCEYTAENHFKLREHLRVEHDTQPGPDEDHASWGDEDEGVTTPKVNSQGKVKTYRCKQCEFSTVTKLEFWEHTRGHIKPERLLTCPKCPFVTEYKHHLEYHLRNHFGSKPFKCDKCSYSCVNKSMLNSHLKSHSNIYQFRCADCAYATKYCHSLKLHLRKYNHNPAMVLNPDGSPNPLPIVDVYGTRRGPKRPKKTDDSPASQQNTVPSLHPMFSSPYGFMPSQPVPYSYNSLLNPFFQSSFQHSSIQFPSNPMMQEEPAIPKSESENNLFSTAISTIRQSAINNNQEGVKEYLTKVISTRQDIIARTANTEELSAKHCHGAPLDLSRPEAEPHEVSVEPIDQTRDQSNVTKSRRKGKAFKLERIAQRLQQQSSDEDEGGEPSPKQLRFDISLEQQTKDEEETSLAVALSDDKSHTSPKVDFCDPGHGDLKLTISEERKARWRNVKEVYDCAYCDMLFGDVVMYTMHMGYHGYQNPYTCNMCGHQTSDRVQFFLHLFRYAHN